MAESEPLRTFTVTLAEAMRLKEAFPEVLTEDTDNLLYINGEVFDAEDLTYGEKRDIRRIIRRDIWDEELDGPFDEAEISENEALPATILVFMRRSNPDATIDEAMAVKPREAYRNPVSNGSSPVDVPPTSSPKPSRSRTSAKAGSQT
jgi:hypothetical protein